MAAQSLKGNFIYQSLYQVITLVIPFIVAPYLTRVLGSNNLGIYTYVGSIASYFVILANLGISKHGQRIIASRRNDNIELRKAFWSLFSVHAIFSMLAIASYVIYVCFVTEYQDIYIIHGLIVLSALVDFTWLYYGLEDFKTVVLRNTIIKVIECVLIFALVRNRGDLSIYTLIICISTLLGQIALLPDTLKRIPPISVSLKECKDHIKPLMILFISVVAVSLYTIFDKTMLGLLSTKDNVAFYEYANRIIMIPKQFIYVIGTVLFPRACALFAKGSFDLLKKYIDLSMYLTSVLSFLFISLIVVCANKFVVLYLGADFAETGKVLLYMSPLIAIVMIGDVIRSEFLIPANKDTLFTSCIVISGVLNVILSYILIPVVGIVGAIIGTTCAELFGTLFQLIAGRKIYSLRELFKIILPFGFISFIVCICINRFDANTELGWTWVFIESAAVVLIYSILSLLVSRSIFNDHFLLIKNLIFKKTNENS